MNRKDYENYVKYKKEKSELYNNFYNDFISKYNNNLSELNNSYSDSMDTIREIEYIIKNRKTLTEITIGVASILGLELLAWVPFIMCKQGTIPSVDNFPIFFILICNFMITILILPEIKVGIECYIKYNKMIKK